MRFLLVCNHPGGARVVTPVARSLIQQTPEPGLSLDIICTANSQAICAADLPAANLLVWPELLEAGDAFYVQATELLQEKYDFVLLGTSIQGNLEQTLIRLARGAQLDTYSVLDHWCDYDRRYDLHTTESALPDLIFAPDTIAEQDLLKAGVASDRIQVAGHPAFDDLPDRARSFTQRQALQIRRQLGLDSGQQFAVFISEPISADHAAAEQGYDEFSVLRRLLEIWQTHLRDWVLILKLHPREADDKFSQVIAGFPDVRVRVAPAELDRHELLLTSTAALGIDSMLLMEASYLNVPVATLQLGYKDPELIAWKSDRIQTIIESEPLIQWLKSVVADRPVAGQASPAEQAQAASTGAMPAERQSSRNRIARRILELTKQT